MLESVSVHFWELWIQSNTAVVLACPFLSSGTRCGPLHFEDLYRKPPYLGVQSVSAGNETQQDSILCNSVVAFCATESPVKLWPNVQHSAWLPLNCHKVEGGVQLKEPHLCLSGGTVAPQSLSGVELSVVLSAIDFVLNEIDLQKAMTVGEERKLNNPCALFYQVVFATVP